MSEDAIRRIIWRCIWQSRGEAPVDRDYAYWIPIWPGLVARGVEINHPNYGEDRLLGWQAGGADVARFGPFADPPTLPHDVPPYPGDAVQPPVPAPVPVPLPTPDSISLRLDAILNKVNDLEVAVLQAIGAPSPTYTGTLWGTKITLVPSK